MSGNLSIDQLAPEQLAELRRSALSATPGPWVRSTNTKAPAVRAETEASEVAKWIRICVAAHTRQGDSPQNQRGEANAEYIAAANPAVILQLLNHIDAQQARIAKLALQLGRIQKLADCGTVQNWLALSDEDKAKWFAVTTQRDSEHCKLIAELEQDAARYRWLRQDESEFSSMAPAELDAAIDKAIAAAQKGGA